MNTFFISLLGPFISGPNKNKKCMCAPFCAQQMIGDHPMSVPWPRPDDCLSQGPCPVAGMLSWKESLDRVSTTPLPIPKQDVFSFQLSSKAPVLLWDVINSLLCCYLITKVSTVCVGGRSVLSWGHRNFLKLQAILLCR